MFTHCSLNLCFYVIMRKLLRVFDFGKKKKYKSWCNWWITLNSTISECGSQCSHSGVWRDSATLTLSPCSPSGVWLCHTQTLSLFFLNSWCRCEVIRGFSLTVKIMLCNRNGTNNYLEMLLWWNLPVSFAHGAKIKGHEPWQRWGGWLPVASEDIISACGSSE